MPYLQRINYQPSAANLTPDEERHLINHFDAYGSEMVIEGQVVPWRVVEAVEVVVAPHISGPAGWIVKYIFQRGKERYHVGVYFGAQEAILPNVTWDVARFVVETIAFYCPNPVAYEGPEELVPLTEI
jgi:hypothetical protein